MAVKVMPAPVAEIVCTQVQLAGKNTVVVVFPLASVITCVGVKTGLQGSLTAAKVTVIPARPFPLQSLKVVVRVTEPPGSVTPGVTVAVEVD